MQKEISSSFTRLTKQQKNIRIAKLLEQITDVGWEAILSELLEFDPTVSDELIIPTLVDVRNESFASKLAHVTASGGIADRAMGLALTSNIKIDVTITEEDAGIPIEEETTHLIEATNMVIVDVVKVIKDYIPNLRRITMDNTIPIRVPMSTTRYAGNKFPTIKKETPITFTSNLGVNSDLYDAIMRLEANIDNQLVSDIKARMTDPQLSKMGVLAFEEYVKADPFGTVICDMVTL